MSLNEAEIYVIDDDAVAREAVAVLVRTLGVQVREFDSAESFLRDYQGHRPACILVDMRMLGMSGLEMLTELRRRGLTIPVILLTAHADTPTTVQAMQSGAFTTLDKPCRETELWDLIRKAVHEDIQRSQDDRRRQEFHQRLAALSSAQREVLQRLLVGEANKMIAHHLEISLRTVESRRKAVFKKMRVDSLAELVKLTLLTDPALLPSSPEK